MDWDQPSIETQARTAVRIVDLRNAIHTELVTLRHQLRIIDEERQSLRGDTNTLPQQRQGSYLLRALLRVGGEELQGARRRYMEADSHLQNLIEEIDRHNAEIDALSFLGGIFRRRAMTEKAQKLAGQREQAMKEHRDVRQAVESLLLRLSRPEAVREAVSMAETLQARYREMANTRRYLTIRQRLVQDDIDLYEETDRLLARLDEQLEVDVHDGELSRLLRDGGFKSTLLNLVS